MRYDHGSDFFCPLCMDFWRNIARVFMSRPTFKEDDEQLVIYMTGAGMLRIFYSSYWFCKVQTWLSCRYFQIYVANVVWNKSPTYPEEKKNRSRILEDGHGKRIVTWLSREKRACLTVWQKKKTKTQKQTKKQNNKQKKNSQTYKIEK